ncbi:MAG: adenine phosphoribosyltransferase [Erysipelotrichaceae bacterium]|nr:adenine phosphoribosyltransferase [Erysipelotrichaceae bacterium]
MKEYCMEVAGLKRCLPFVKINDELAFASFVIISDTEMVATAAPLLVNRIGECDIIVTAEAKGIALAYEISRLLGHKHFVVARKSSKSYMTDTISVHVRSITTFTDQQLLLDSKDAELVRGKKVCLVDDVVSTGQSLQALKELVEKAGATVVSNVCILAEGHAADRDDLIYLEKLPLFKKTGDGEYEVLDD